MYVYYDGYNRGFSVKSLVGYYSIPIRNLLRDGSGGGSDDDILACIEMYSTSESNRMIRIIIR